MKDDIMMQRGYAAVRDKSQYRYASSEDEMNFNEQQARGAGGQEQVNRSDNMPLVNPTKNPNIKFSPSSAGNN